MNVFTPLKHRIISIVITLFNKIKAPIIRLRIRFCMRPGALNKAIRQAKQLHRETGRRYRVFFFGYQYYVWTRDDIKERKRNELFKWHLKAGEDFDRISFFDTNNI